MKPPRLKKNSGMTLIEVALALGITMGILYAGSIQVSIQGEIWRQAHRLEFYTRELPRIGRALHSLSMEGQNFFVASDVDSTGGVQTGTAIAVMVRSTDGTIDKKNVIYFEPKPDGKGKIRYKNSAGKTWYLAKNISNASFTMNADSTITAFIDGGDGVVAEFVVERM